MKDKKETSTPSSPPLEETHTHPHLPTYPSWAKEIKMLPSIPIQDSKAILYH